MIGGNAWISYILASIVSSSDDYDSTNATLLTQGPAVLTLDFTQGEALDPVMLLETVDLARDYALEETADLAQSSSWTSVAGYVQGERCRTGTGPHERVADRPVPCESQVAGDAVGGRYDRERMA